MDPRDDPGINDSSDTVWANDLEPFERECLDELHSDPDSEERLADEKNLYEQQIFLTFQASATAIAQLYRGN